MDKMNGKITSGARAVQKVLSPIENIFFSASPVSSHWISEQAVEVWHWWRLWYLSSQANTDTIVKLVMHVTQCMSSSLLRNFQQCRSSNNAQCVVHLCTTTCCFCVISNNNSEPTQCFVLAGLISGYCPTFFWDTLSLMRKTPFINILLIFACTAPLGLISYQALLLMGYHNTQEVSYLPGLPITGQLLWRKPDNQQIFFESKWPQSVRRHVLFFSKPSKPLHLLKRKRILVIYSQIKPLNGPLFCDSARSSISVSFREMKPIRKGQGDSQLQELWIFFSLVSDNAADTVVLCSRGRIKRAW